MNIDKIKDVLSDNLGEGFKIVDENGEMTAAIEWSIGFNCQMTKMIFK